MYDVIIVGGGPAGMSAALVLGRCRRNVLLCDTGESRNALSPALNGYLTRDGIHPKEFLAIGREELARYNIHRKQTEVTASVCREDGIFELKTAEGETLLSKKLLLATGVLDYWPEIPGAEPYYGKSIHHCPYCDGWEEQNKAMVAYGIGRVAIGLSLSLKTWSDDVTLCTDGSKRLTTEDREKLERNGVKVRTEKIKELKGNGEYLEFMVFANKEVIPCQAIFFSMGTYQHSSLLRQMNCEFTTKGVARADVRQKTKTPGLYVAGDATRDMQQVIIAAAEGAKAGISINKELQLESYK